MEERIETIEAELEIIRFAYEQNKLFIESNNDTMDAALALLKIMPEFMNTVNDRLDKLENLFSLLKDNQKTQSQTIEVMGRNIKHLVDIVS